jgi:hypothetical protein
MVNRCVLKCSIGLLPRESDEHILGSFHIESLSCKPKLKIRELATNNHIAIKITLQF